jgi:CheY-like chemotaxis protein
LPPHNSRILVVEDVQETREAIGLLLEHDGYRVDCARDEQEAIERIQQHRPDLILVSLSGTPDEVMAASRNIRARGGLSQLTPIVIFSLQIVPDGADEKFPGNVHVIVPDNFDHLRCFLMLVLGGASRTH